MVQIIHSFFYISFTIYSQLSQITPKPSYMDPWPRKPQKRCIEALNWLVDLSFRWNKTFCQFYFSFISCCASRFWTSYRLIITISYVGIQRLWVLCSIQKSRNWYAYGLLHLNSCKLWWVSVQNVSWLGGGRLSTPCPEKRGHVIFDYNSRLFWWIFIIFYRWKQEWILHNYM